MAYDLWNRKREADAKQSVAPLGSIQKGLEFLRRDEMRRIQTERCFGKEVLELKKFAGEGYFSETAVEMCSSHPLTLVALCSVFARYRATKRSLSVEDEDLKATMLLEEVGTEVVKMMRTHDFEKSLLAHTAQAMFCEPKILIVREICLSSHFDPKRAAELLTSSEAYCDAIGRKRK